MKGQPLPGMQSQPLPPPVRKQATASGGPPRPPAFWNRGGDGGGGWSKRALILLCVLLAFGAVLSIALLVRGLLGWPLPVSAALLVTGVHWLRSKPLANSRGPDAMASALPWAVAAGAIGFVLGQLPLPRVIGEWGMLAIGAGGIGGAVGLFTWIFAAGALTSVAAIRDLVPMIRRDRWDGAA